MFFLQMFSDETFYLETVSENMTYGIFHQGRESTAFEFAFFYLAMKPIHLLIYFKNFCNFGCIFTSLPVSLVKLVSKGSVFPNLALSFVVWRKKEKIRKMPFITIKLVNKIDEDHSLVFTNLHASYRNFKNKSKNVLNAQKNQNYSIQ